MNSKIIIGGVIGGVISFFLGWLIFGILLHNYYQANTQQYTWLFKEHPVMWALAIANLSWGILLAYVLNLAGAKTIAKGFSTGFILFFLVALGTDMFQVGLMNLIKIRLAIIDSILNGLLGGVIGVVISLWYGRSSKETI